MGNFKNVIVGGGVLTVDGVDVGFLKGQVQLQRTLERLTFESGLPLVPQGQVPTKEVITLTAPAAEITPDNLSRTSATIPVVTNAGTQVTVADNDNQERTFAAYEGGALEAIVLDGPTVVGLVVENTAESVTYTNNTDYILDATRGIVWRNPGGAIASGATVRVTYQYTPPASKEIRFGKNYIFTNVNVKFVHNSVTDTKVHTIEFYKAQGSGDINLAFDETNFVITNIVFTSIPDPTNHPNDPMGYYRVTTGTGF